ncbi:MAG: cell envelope biogenesis protein OmpA [Acetobacteraceae bacterium]|nr:cell envelope biogenesis protein OmpA [Acetobacteraceae bacterium]MBV8526469.1 cell envelope biogenesis protein OmpA [Acetobacteraceae bacterium]
MKRLVTPCAAVLCAALGLSACTNPYDPGQRAVGGGLLGASTGAAIGAAAGGGRGAGTGALIGGAVGALGGAVTTPTPPSAGYYQSQPPAYPPASGYYQPQQPAYPPAASYGPPPGYYAY